MRILLTSPGYGAFKKSCQILQDGTQRVKQKKKKEEEPSHHFQISHPNCLGDVIFLRIRHRHPETIIIQNAGFIRIRFTILC